MKDPIRRFLMEKAAKPNIQLLYDKGFFDNFDNADEVLKDYLLCFQ